MICTSILFTSVALLMNRLVPDKGSMTTLRTCNNDAKTSDNNSETSPTIMGVGVQCDECKTSYCSTSSVEEKEEYHTTRIVRD